MATLVCRIRGAVCLAMFLLVAQTAALAHELDHALEHHDDPSCQFHLYTAHVAKAFGIGTHAIPLLHGRNLRPVSIVSRPAGQARTAVFRSRAPPGLPG